MKKQKWLVLVTAVGLLGTTAAATAGGLVEKVTGILHNDVAISVNGQNTSLHPIYIDGKAYLPVRDTAAALGYQVSWNGTGKQIDLQGNVEQIVEADHVQISGLIASVTATGDQYRVEVLGHGPNNWIILYVDKDTVLTGADGKTPFSAKDLNVGQQVIAQYGPVIAMSYPGQSHANSLQVGEQRLIKEDDVLTVEHTSDGWQLQFGELQDGVDSPSLTLNAGKETMVVSEEGQPVEWTQIKPGSKVRAYYGPIMTKSLPPQSPVYMVVVLGQQLDTASVKEYRDLAWTFVKEEDKKTLLTKQDEAQVSIFDAKGAAIVPVAGKEQVLADIVAKNGKLISVNYSTDQDALLGPLMIVIDPETKALIGSFQRM